MRGRRSHVSRLRRFLRVALTLMGALLTCAVVFFISLAARMPDLSQLEPYNPALKTRILASDGTVVATLHKENRLWKPLSSGLSGAADTDGLPGAILVSRGDPTGTSVESAVCAALV